MSWIRADKHKPVSCNQLLGNGGSVQNLKNWLSKWHGMHVTKTTPMPKFGRQNPGAKAALISGPPGIGKSSCAALIAREMGFELQEYNASDARSKKLLETALADVLGTRSLFGSFHKLSVSGKHAFGAGGSSGSMNKAKSRGRLIIMDEVDGMGAGDRGGMVGGWVSVVLCGVVSVV